MADDHLPGEHPADEPADDTVPTDATTGEPPAAAGPETPEETVAGPDQGGDAAGPGGAQDVTAPVGWGAGIEGEPTVPIAPAAPEPPPGPGGAGAPEAARGWPAPPPTTAGWGTPPGPPASPPSGPPSPPGARPGRLRQTLLAGLVGGLVGALVASGVYLVADDDGGETRVVERTPVGSNTSVMTEPADVQEVLARVEPAVVAIQVTQDGPASQLLGENVSAGSGFVISPDGFIVTNNHVISDETGTQVGGDIEVTFSDGETMPAEVVGRDPVTDLAVIQVDGENLPFAEIGDSDSLQVGDDVVAIGNALALEGGLSVTRGIVSALGRQVPTETGTVLTDAIQTDAAINRGNSGGPLVNASGEVVGINTAIADPQVAQNVGFAIAIAQAMPVIEQLRQGEDVEVAFLGVQTQTVTPAVVRELDLSVDRGAVVVEVTPRSPARAAGITQYDVILEVAGEEVDDSADVAAVVRRFSPGDSVTIVLDRDGEEVTVEATLASRSDFLG